MARRRDDPRHACGGQSRSAAYRCAPTRLDVRARVACSMILRMSSLFVRTLREDPADAEVPSHRLLVRAGYIRRAAPGIYTWLPLGLRVLRKIEGIIREEMDAIGAQELHVPRAAAARALRGHRPLDRRTATASSGSRTARAPTTCSVPRTRRCSRSLVKDLYSSYKDLPLSIYQIQTKYRDEARPRAGLLRGREFVMKDSYSFDVDDAGLDRSLPGAPRRLHPDLRPARLRLRHRQGDVRRDGRLEVRGVPGQAPTSARTPTSAARTATTPPTSRRSQVPAARPVPYDDAPAAHAEQTPGHPDDRDAGRPPQREVPARRPALGRPATPSRTCWSTLKHPDGTREPLAIGVPGDREVDQKRLEGQIEPTEVEPFDEAEFEKYPALVKGYIGPGVLGREERDRHPLPRRPPRRRGHPLGDRRRRRRQPRDRPGRRPRLHPRRHDRGRRGPRRRRLPELRRRHARVGPRHRDGPHLPARPQVRRRARPAGARRERQARHRHDGLLRHRPVARRSRRSPRAPTTSSACPGRARSRPPTSTSSRPARTRRSSPPPSGSPTSSTRRASTCSTTTGPRSAPA